VNDGVESSKDRKSSFSLLRVVLCCFYRAFGSVSDSLTRQQEKLTPMFDELHVTLLD
jgi:hypothetical protein